MEGIDHELDLCDSERQFLRVHVELVGDWVGENTEGVFDFLD